MAEYYADPYCLESQNLGTTHFLIHVVTAEGQTGFKGWLLGSQETGWERGNLATLLVQYILSCTILTLASSFRGFHVVTSVSLVSPPPHSQNQIWSWALNGCNFVTLKEQLYYNMIFKQISVKGNNEESKLLSLLQTLHCINMLYFLPYEYHILVFMLQLARQHLLIATFNTAYQTA